MNKTKKVLYSFVSILLISTSCKTNDNKTISTNSTTTSSNLQSTRIAYINVDTLQEKYAYWKTQTDLLVAEQTKMEQEIQSTAQKLQNEYAAFQQKAQSGSLTESEGKAAQQRLMQAQQQLENRRNNLSEEIQKKQLAFSEKLQKNIDEYLAIYNKDNKYDYILSYSKVGQVLYANKSLDITEDVVKGLNSYNSEQSTSK